MAKTGDRGERTRDGDLAEGHGTRPGTGWRAGLALAGGLGALALVACSGGDRPERLNVLLLTLDTTRADHLGCYGDPEARTPNIDRVAAEGAVFTRCTSASPLTLPSHASMMTAKYPFAHGARRNGTDRLAEGNTTLAEALAKDGYATAATVASFVLNRKFGLAQGFDQYRDVAVDSTENPLYAERRGDEVATEAIGLLRGLAGRPFFLWVHLFDPHWPYEAPPAEDGPEDPGGYAGEIAFMDRQIGRILDELQALGLDGKTLVVLLGDHGEGLDEHQEWTHGYFLYDSTLRVPLILRCPGKIPAGLSIDEQVRTVDLAPTVAELIESREWHGVQGVSIAPWFRGEAPEMALAAYGESLEASAQFGLSRLRSLSLEGWKYVLAPAPELYQLEDDPGESRNLFAERPDRAASLREQLRALIAAAPPPPPAEASAALVGAAEIARLESLGYVVAGTGEDDRKETELERFEPRGANPLDHARSFKLSSEARVAMTEKRYLEAEEALRELVAALPESSRLRSDLAGSLHRQGQLDEALRLYAEALEMAPDDSHIRGQYGTALFAAGRKQEAIDQFSAVLSRAPDDTAALFNMAVTLITQDQLKVADPYLERARQLEPKSAPVLHLGGVLRFRLGDPAGGAELCRRALAIDPGFERCRRDLETMEQAAGR